MKDGVKARYTLEFKREAVRLKKQKKAASALSWASSRLSMAEEVGFEPTDGFPRRRFSRPVP